MENLVGKQLGAYKILQRLGRGGMGSVYRAQRSSQPLPEVAIKVLLDLEAAAEDTGFAARFKHEIGVLARLKHPHIVPLLDYGEAEGYPYMVMPIFSGGTLGERFKATGPLPAAEVIKLAVQIGSALEYAHQEGLVHRDVKPANILIDEVGDYRLADFGIARSLASTTRYTTTGALVGTPIYMSPEQAQGLPTDHRSDIYAFGSVLYEMATGRPPFVADDAYVLMRLHIEGALNAPRVLNPAIPRQLEQVIVRALAKRPEERYQHMRELVAALQAPASQTPAPETARVLLPTPWPAPRSPNPWLSDRKQWGIIGTLFLASVLLFLMLVVGGYVMDITRQLNVNSTQLALVSQRAVEIATEVAGYTSTPSLTAPPTAAAPTVTLSPSPVPTLVQGEVAKIYRDNLLLGVVHIGELIQVPASEHRYLAINHNATLTQSTSHLYALNNSAFTLTAVTDPRILLNVAPGTDLLMNTGPYPEGSEVQLAGGGPLALRGQGCWALEYLTAAPAAPKVRMSCFMGTCAYRLNLATDFATFPAGWQLVIDDVTAPVPSTRRTPILDANKYYNLLLFTPTGLEDHSQCNVVFTGVTSTPTATPTSTFTPTPSPTLTPTEGTPGEGPTDTPTPPITETLTPTPPGDITPTNTPSLAPIPASSD